MLLAARKILEHSAKGADLSQAQVHLDARFQHYAGLFGAVGNYFLHSGQCNQGITHSGLEGFGGDAHQVNVPNGLLPAAQAAGRVELLQVGTLGLQGSGGFLGNGQSLADGSPPVPTSIHSAEGMNVVQDVVRRPLAHAGQGGHLALVDGLSMPSMVLTPNSWVISMAVLEPMPGMVIRVKTPSGSSASNLS